MSDLDPRYLARRVEVYKRGAGDVVSVVGENHATYDWRRIAPNGRITATSGGQGYANRSKARQVAELENPGLPVSFADA
jgi:uncharacterized protein YegP (UPF0339 family)